MPAKYLFFLRSASCFKITFLSVEELTTAFTANLGKLHLFYLPKRQAGILYPQSLCPGVLELVPGFGGVRGVSAEGSMMSCP